MNNYDQKHRWQPIMQSSRIQLAVNPHHVNIVRKYLLFLEADIMEN